MYYLINERHRLLITSKQSKQITDGIGLRPAFRDSSRVNTKTCELVVIQMKLRTKLLYERIVLPFQIRIPSRRGGGEKMVRSKNSSFLHCFGSIILSYIRLPRYGSIESVTDLTSFSFGTGSYSNIEITRI